MTGTPRSHPARRATSWSTPGNDAAATTYPCAYALPNVVCVAASDNRDRLAGFSNYGATAVDLAAPGLNIASTWPGGGYSWSSGTSMATPHVSGAAALLWAASPGAQPTDISSALLGGVDALPAFTGRTVSGGRLNVLRSLRLVADVGAGAPAPVPEPGGGSDAGGPGTPGAEPSQPSSGQVGDAVRPRLSIRLGRRFRSALLARRRLRLRARSSEACSVRLALRLHGRALTVPVRVALRADISRRVALRLNRSGRAVLSRRGSFPLTLVARAADPAGNRRTLRVSVRVSR